MLNLLDKSLRPVLLDRSQYARKSAPRRHECQTGSIRGRGARGERRLIHPYQVSMASCQPCHAHRSSQPRSFGDYSDIALLQEPGGCAAPVRRALTVHRQPYHGLHRFERVGAGGEKSRRGFKFDTLASANDGGRPAAKV